MERSSQLSTTCLGITSRGCVGGSADAVSLGLDLAHSAEEDHFHVTVYSWHGRLLVVTVAEGGATIQIISARRAMKRERHEYEDT